MRPYEWDASKGALVPDLAVGPGADSRNLVRGEVRRGGPDTRRASAGPELRSQTRFAAGGSEASP